ncbi:hypothetical protein NDU88_006823 [Pleurodeles waltl]|uniref:Secreted protein n=1 Tax=Pleurodeles waltl TaxID=8319 RepID=A0AAV7PJY5_PLEWA|nr:hypothetical protein NDU88_006823 [Pleurodeles waltl]
MAGLSVLSPPVRLVGRISSGVFVLVLSIVVRTSAPISLRKIWQHSPSAEVMGSKNPFSSYPLATIGRQGLCFWVVDR